MRLLFFRKPRSRRVPPLPPPPPCVRSSPAVMFTSADNGPQIDIVLDGLFKFHDEVDHQDVHDRFRMGANKKTKRKRSYEVCAPKWPTCRRVNRCPHISTDAPVMTTRSSQRDPGCLQAVALYRHHLSAHLLHHCLRSGAAFGVDRGLGLGAKHVFDHGRDHSGRSDTDHARGGLLRRTTRSHHESHQPPSCLGSSCQIDVDMGYDDAVADSFGGRIFVCVIGIWW